MNRTPQDRPVRYIATIEGAREVTLVGAASWDYWKVHLEGSGLTPYRAADRAELLVSATALRWMGVRFNELAVALAVSLRPDASSRDGVYLVQAFNTSRVLAFLERALFHTPYQHGHVAVNSEDPYSFRLTRDGHVALGAERLEAAPATETIEDTWEGAIYLPARGGKGGRGELFYARLGGQTEVHRWRPSVDVLTLRPSRGDGPVAALVDSGFVGVEWRVRRHATHARSKTYRSTVP